MFPSAKEGAIRWETSWLSSGRGASSIIDTGLGGIIFDSSKVVPTADEVRPICISFLYLIAY